MDEMYRQGDVLLIKIKNLPKDELKQKDRVLLTGETTGHSHRIEGDAVVYTDKNGMQFIQVQKRAQLVHEEHGMIELEEGNYEMRRQREYTPQAPRLVMD
jgi:hypothetical protein